MTGAGGTISAILGWIALGGLSGLALVYLARKLSVWIASFEDTPDYGSDDLYLAETTARILLRGGEDRSEWLAGGGEREALRPSVSDVRTHRGGKV